MTRTDEGSSGIGTPRHPVGRGIASAAVLIAVITVLARMAGFLRIVVFTRTAGVTCLSSTYITANTIPNIVFDVVAGGALASLVVPVLAGPVAAGDRARIDRTASALLTWTLVILVPLTVVAAVLVHPVMGLLTGHPHVAGCTRGDIADVGSRMLYVFLPQIPLYGVGIVLAGILQSHRKFLGPALAPLLSSLTVIAAYLAYGYETRKHAAALSALPRSQELTLSVGTTLGVVVLSLSLLIPMRHTGMRFRPTLHFTDGVARRVRGLAYAGAAALAAQQLTTAVALVLANTHGPEGAALLFTLGWTVFLLPWAVLAVPIATSAFPVLVARHDEGDEAGYADAAASTTRAVVLITLVAAAAVAAAADPVARVLVVGTRGAADPTVLARTVTLFAPGIVGYSLIAHVGRAFYARGNGRTPAVATVIGWAVVVAADFALVLTVPADWQVAALGAGTSIGMTVSGVLLIVGLGRATRGAAVAGLTRATAAGVGAAIVGYAAGRAVVHAIGATRPLENVFVGLACGAVVLVVFAAIVLAFDGTDLRLAMSRLRHPLGSGATGA